MLMVFYSGLLALALVARTLLWIVPTLKSKPDEHEYAQRFGRVPPALAQAAAGRRVVWLHAVSVGEVLAASRLIAELEAALGPGWLVVISTTTRTGQALARQRFGTDRAFYMPLDFAFAVRPYLRLLRPAALVLMESEVWPRMMHECRKIGTPVIVVNARVSDRSFKRSLLVRWIWSRVLRKATLWLAQSDEDARRLVAMGAPTEDVRVGGNLKYDVRSGAETAITSRIRALLPPTSRVLVAGSTLSGEEEILLESWPAIARMAPASILILAPRHPERFNEVEDLIRKHGFAPWRASALSNELAWNSQGAAPVILLDTIGDLASIYRLARVAFIGGSLVPKGGHNPLEPAQYAVPVVMGESYENFRDVVKSMIATGGIVIGDKAVVADGASILLSDDKAAAAYGKGALQAFESESGATARAVAAILTLLPGAPQ